MTLTDDDVDVATDPRFDLPERFEDAGLTHRQKALYGVLLKRAGDSLLTWPTHETLAAEMGSEVTPRMVKFDLKRLEECGAIAVLPWIKWDGSPSSNTYVVWPAAASGLTVTDAEIVAIRESSLLPGEPGLGRTTIGWCLSSWKEREDLRVTANPHYCLSLASFGEDEVGWEVHSDDTERPGHWIRTGHMVTTGDWREYRCLRPKGHTGSHEEDAMSQFWWDDDEAETIPEVPGYSFLTNAGTRWIIPPGIATKGTST